MIRRRECIMNSVEPTGQKELLSVRHTMTEMTNEKTQLKRRLIALEKELAEVNLL